MKIKHIIGGVLIALGALAALGAIGHLDYLDHIGERYGAAEVNAATVKSVAGLAAMCFGMFLCRDIEVDEIETSEDKHCLEEKENRAD